MKPHRRRILLLGLTLTLALLALLVLLREGERRQVQAFADHYAQLHQESDVEGLLDLFNWQGVPPHHRRRLQIALQAETRYPLARVTIHRTDTQAVADAFRNTDITLNLSPRWRMEAVLATEDSLSSTYWLGRTREGQWKIAGAKDND